MPNVWNVANKLRPTAWARQMITGADSVHIVLTDGARELLIADGFDKTETVEVLHDVEFIRPIDEDIAADHINRVVPCFRRNWKIVG